MCAEVLSIYSFSISSRRAIFQSRNYLVPFLVPSVCTVGVRDQIFSRRGASCYNGGNISHISCGGVSGNCHIIHWTVFPYCCSGTSTVQPCISAVRQNTTCLELSWIQLWCPPSREVQLEFIHLFSPLCGVYWRLVSGFTFCFFPHCLCSAIFSVLLVICVLIWGLHFVFIKLIEVGKFVASSDWQMFMFKNIWLVLHALAQYLCFDWCVVVLCTRVELASYGVPSTRFLSPFVELSKTCELTSTAYRANVRLRIEVILLREAFD